ncbi:glycine zipper family protein [Methylomonas rosea]|uniref:Glycine zipper family protein n=1 Tax=Methylomonas rosea TaxID=2952227 RepID=A0ABT1TVD5_9GAMM|nr:glycine zipper family protein [Methylomonas sp. WSC-7]MCQ8118500.1 glycine zipper family protein [Methylomonas sp. WSC-7]PPD24636.1 MAG: hypothetical protein CTY24_00165 [Methylobacter sp.]
MRQCKIKHRLIVSALLAVTGCASVSGYRPAVDTFNDPNAYRLNQDMNECEQLATQASGGILKETATGAAVGGLIGGGGGAAGGAVFGNAGTGAAIGAAVGVLGGAAKQGLEANNRYKLAYNTCLRNRGHNVIN